MSPKLLLRTVSIAEAVTWTLLLLGMVLKYGFHTADWLVSVAGSAHGAVFLAYLFCGLLVGVNQRFSWGALVLGGLAAIPPYATLAYDWWAQRRGLLEGGWRTVAVAYGERATLDDEAVPALDAWEADQQAVDAREVLAASGEVPESAPEGGAAHAHPADARVATRGERPAKLGWLQPLVHWSVEHPFTLGAGLIVVFALILTGSLSGSLTAPYAAPAS